MSRVEEFQNALTTIEGLARIPRPQAIVEGWLYADSLAWIGGKPGHGKSFVALDIALSITSGRDWQGHPTKQGRVLYVIAEGASGIADRTEAWCGYRGFNPWDAGDITFLPLAPNLADATDIDAFCALLPFLEPAAIVIDTQARVTLGMEENSSRDMGRFVDTLERIRRQSGACVIVVHHEPRSGDNLRGSTALEGAATTILRVTKDGPVLTVSTNKQKDAEPAPPMTLALTPFMGSAVPSHASDTLSQTETDCFNAVLETWNGSGATPTQVKDHTGLSSATVSRTLNSLRNKGKVTVRTEGQRKFWLPRFKDDQPELT